MSKLAPILLLILMASCSAAKRTAKKIEKAKAVAIANPGAFAGVCAVLFPVRDSLIKGEPIVVTDTLYSTDVIIDTVQVAGEPIVITKTLPAKVITNTITRTDTVVKENTARVEALRLQLNEATDRGLELSRENDDLKEENEAMKKRLGKGFIFPWWLVIVCGILLAGIIYLYAKGKTIKGLIGGLKR